MAASATSSDARISSIAGRQPPQSPPAWQERAISRRVDAPPRTALRIARSLMPWQWQMTMFRLPASR